MSSLLPFTSKFVSSFLLLFHSTNIGVNAQENKQVNKLTCLF